MTRPACTFTSSESPGCNPSSRRIGPGSTTWPFVESLVSMVRQSYHVLGKHSVDARVLGAMKPFLISSSYGNYVSDEGEAIAREAYGANYDGRIVR
jgi:hypothetical protein